MEGARTERDRSSGGGGAPGDTTFNLVLKGWGYGDGACYEGFTPRKGGRGQQINSNSSVECDEWYLFYLQLSVLDFSGSTLCLRLRSEVARRRCISDVIGLACSS